ncbi:MAG: hypothetical protein IJW21_07235 [Clostridia bacterium]|nr:hypothetical protein [Clostridia bacterium]
MKNKITALIICAAMLFAILTLGVCATGAPLSLTSGIFTIINTTENTEFSMADAELSQVTTDYFDTSFDSGKYDATYYGAYRASLLVDGIAAAFTGNMDVTLTLGDEYAEKEIFVFYITNEGTASPKVEAVQEGASLTISGEDFAAMSGNIIVVMTSNQSVNAEPASPIVPAVICAAVALVAIVASVIVVKKKNTGSSIIE